MRSARGFSLLEVIATAAMVAALSAIALPRLGGFSQSTDDTAARASLMTAVAAAENASSTGLEGLPATWPASGGAVIPGKQLVPELTWANGAAASTDARSVSAGAVLRTTATGQDVVGVGFAALGADGECFLVWRPSPADPGSLSTLFMVRHTGGALPCAGRSAYNDQMVSGTGTGASFEDPKDVSSATALTP